MRIVVIVVSCSCLGVLCLAQKLDTNFCTVSVSGCVLLFVVELVVVIVVILLLCVLRGVRVVAPHRSSLGGIALW